MPVLLVSAAALVNARGEVLLAERPAHKSLAGKWEFPGGKVEANESPEAALIRELKEELGIEVPAPALEPFHFLSHDYPEFGFHLMMPVWLVRDWHGEPQPLEHAALHWAKPQEMHALPMIEADKPLVEKLKSSIR